MSQYIKLMEEQIGETLTDQKIAESEANRIEQLRNIGWEILDLIPAGKAVEFQEELISEIISEGWDNE